jgi:hypothetical protein
MTPATIIREAQAAGVNLILSPTGTMKATGDGAAVNLWLPVIREHKARIVEALKVGAGGRATAPMTGDEAAAIRAWLALIEETNPATIAEVIGKCQRDAEARDYFIGRAAAEVPKPDPFPDDRRPCNQCANLRQRACAIAKPERGALVVANRGYRPDPARLLRCEGYAPKLDDTDQQPGAERWPGLREVTP